MKNISFTLAGFLLFGCGVLSAQHYNRHEVFFSVGVGLHQLQYTTGEGSISSHPGGMASLGYIYFFNEHWGLSSGIEGSYYNTTLKLHEFTSVTHGLNDGQGHTFDFHSTVKEYSEIQNAYMLTIPLMAAYQIGKFNRFYVMGGIKVDFPFGNYQSTGNYINKGYFPDKDNWGIDQKFMGFGRFDNEKNEGKIKYNPSCMLALEFGAKWYTDGKWSLYTGLYGEYGLNSIVSSDKKEFISYQPNTSRIYSNGSALLTEYINNDKQVIRFTDKIRPLSFGFRMRVSMEW